MILENDIPSEAILFVQGARTSTSSTHKNYSIIDIRVTTKRTSQNLVFYKSNIQNKVD